MPKPTHDAKEILEKINTTEWSTTRKLGFVAGVLSTLYTRAMVEVIQGFKDGFDEALVKSIVEELEVPKGKCQCPFPEENGHRMDCAEFPCRCPSPEVHGHYPNCSIHPPH